MCRGQLAVKYTDTRNHYFYKLTTDNGGAPCIWRGVLSLAICKPSMRRTALVGDWVFGFAAKRLESDNRLIYIARVTGKELGGGYYQDARYSGRADRIYQWRGGKFHWRTGAAFHGAAHIAHDLGKPPRYASSAVLLSTDFRYFGTAIPEFYKTRYPAVAKAVEDLGQGHRKYHSNTLQQELWALQRYCWRRYSRKLISRPRLTPDCTIKLSGGACGVVEC